MNLHRKNFTAGLACFLLAAILVACDKKPLPAKIPGEGAFATVSESSIAGRYKWFENGTELGVITLVEDHSVITYRGETKKGYRWDLQKEGLLLVWLKGFNFFPNIVQPGIYEGRKNSATIRIEKQ